MSRLLLIASRPRCGTHYLKSLLGSCPRVQAFEEEVFHPLFRGNAGFYDGLSDPGEWLTSQCDPAAALSVIAAHSDQVTPWIQTSIEPVLTDVLILYRRDVLAQYVSYTLADRADAWCTTIGQPHPADTLTLDRDLLRDFFVSSLANLHADVIRWYQLQPRALAYEDLVGDQSGTLAALADWLQIDVTAATPATAKHEVRPLWVVVSNYQQARQWAASCPISDSRGISGGKNC